MNYFHEGKGYKDYSVVEDINKIDQQENKMFNSLEEIQMEENQRQTINLDEFQDPKPLRRVAKKKAAVISVEISQMETLKSDEAIVNEEKIENKICIIY
jgi:hypothetical protein